MNRLATIRSAVIAVLLEVFDKGTEEPIAENEVAIDGYGGSSLLMMLSCIGILFNIAAQSGPADEDFNSDNLPNHKPTLTSVELSA